MKTRLYLVHAQGRYGENTYIPFTVGCLWAYARTFPEIAAAYEFCGFLYLKERIEDAVAKLDNPHLIGISHYIWNAEWNKAFAKAVKERWPNCKIIVGGVQVHDESPRTLEECPAFDFAIYGEGEGAFAQFLRARCVEEDRAVAWSRPYDYCGSLIYRSGADVFVNRRAPFVDLKDLRSPYLDGVFDDLWQLEPRWQVNQEWDRGCPYGCCFCSWGQASLNDLRLFPEERIRAEIEWFGKHKVDYLDQADANFGIVKRDVELTNALVATKEKYGYPKTFRTSFAKNSNETIWTIANLLHDAKMLKSVTLAMQSMDDDVLVNIKRKNIKVSKFGELIGRYEEAGIPTYTELILGLPGETRETFARGIEENLNAGQHTGLFVYINLMLNNTEQNTPEYIEKHGLVILPLQAMLSHGVPDPSAIHEIQPVVVGTSAMPMLDWVVMWLHSKCIEIFHSQGLLQYTARKLYGSGFGYQWFYDLLYEWAESNTNSIIARELTSLAALLKRVLSGGSWDCVDPRFGDISWPPEEFAFARICCELEQFYSELEPFFRSLPNGKRLLDEQRKIISGPTPGNEAAWARDVVWYGRRGYSAIKMNGG